MLTLMAVSFKSYGRKKLILDYHNNLNLSYNIVKEPLSQYLHDAFVIFRSASKETMGK